MFDLLHLPANVVLAYAAYAVGSASPGPSNLAVMGTAISQGRSRALVLALGVSNGSLIWGLAAAFGLSSILQAYSWSLVAMKLAGGAYMLWLAWKAARAAASPASVMDGQGVAATSLPRTYVKGLAMHLTNPKSIFLWSSIVALALPPDGRQGDAVLVVAGCGLLGITVFVTYALVFSTRMAQNIYGAVHRWFNAGLALVFAFAGIRMIFSRTGPV